jgi:putative ABC transport system permease protein
MTILMTFRIALKALNRNKLRTTLTMLGMIIGVGAVITMVALGNGAQVSIEQQIQSAGTNVIMVNAGNFSSGGVRQGQGMSNTLTADDATAIREVPGVQYLVETVRNRGGQVVFGNQNWNTSVEGTNVDLPMIKSWALESGTFLTPSDISSASKVCVIGTTVKSMLFPEGNDPVGEIIRIGKHPFKIVGVLTSKGQSSVGQDQDDVIYAPFTTVQKKMRGITYIEGMTVSAASADNIKATADAISAVLRVRHKIQPGDNDDFMVRTLEDIAAVRTETTRTMTMLLASIAGVSLLVGGIGIMNIMLVSVTERTREIGLRLAIGARGGDVLLQFLVEAVVISLLGGTIGIGLGYALSQSLTQFMQWPTYVSPQAVMVAFGFAAGIGIFFGFYPARKASALDPIEALRYE